MTTVTNARDSVYQNFPEAILSARKSVAVDVSAGDQALATGCRAVYVGVDGDILLQLKDDAAPVLRKNCKAGAQYAWQAILIKSLADGTTATGIVAEY